MPKFSYPRLLLLILVCMLTMPAYAENPSAPVQPDSAAVTPLTRAQVDQFNMNRWLALDKQRNGKISFDEFLERGFKFDDSITDEAKERILLFIRYAFNQYDADSDGFITAEEYASYHNHRFDEIDTNNDMILSPEEIAADEILSRQRFEAYLKEQEKGKEVR